MVIDISVIIPAYNEHRSILLLYQRIVDSLKDLNKSFEIIFIDDGSNDETFDRIKLICKKDVRVIGLRFSKNFKKSAAYMAGFEKSSGKIIITMDADLQDEASEIPRMIRALDKLDLVVGWKYPRQDPFYKRFPSKIFNRLNKTLFGVKLHDNDCGFRAMKSEVAKSLSLYGDLYRYIPALSSRNGFKIGEIKVKHNKRQFGKSKYGWKRLITGPLDLLTVKVITDYNQRPLHLFGTAGIGSFFIGFLAEVYVVCMKFFANNTFSTHLPMMIFGVLLMLLGVQLLGIGLVAELVTSSRTEKRYKLVEVLNHEK